MRLLSCVVAVTAGAALLASAPGLPASADPAKPVAIPPAPAAKHTLTLITGDVVDVQTHADGRQVAVARPPAAGRKQPAVKTVLRRGDLYVIPETARRLLAEGRLDEQLFNVTDLIAAGYDDARRASLPLIVTHGAKSAKADPALAGTRTVRQLPSANATAVERTPGQAAAFWAQLNATTAPRDAAAAPYPKIWLDRPVRATLEESVPQVGAPAAWSAGVDGKGVKVAVLDTGADAAHPDLKDRIAASANFSDAEDTGDRSGHGTHVAATIAGSGAADAGRRKGVAPGATLLVGKVLNDRGVGSLSWIIAGMEWAAAQQADVVNMSLGTDEPTDGTDPLSQALNTLTAQSGALFVVAAGNDGPQEGTVGSPGAADAALTVGAVSKSDALADFSSRGPRYGDDALKPEISAPGVAIVAARAAGTSPGTPVDEHYTSLSGTSMATPHVAGAAALLAQRHPGWTPVRLKASLVSSAKPVDGPVDAVGSGRLDVARAFGQQVRPSPATVSLPTETPAGSPRSATVELANEGGAPVTLDLALDLPKEMFTLSSAQVTVPAGGKAAIMISSDPAKGERGRYAGRLRATGGGVEISVPVVQTLTPVRHQVEIPVTYRDGGAPGDGSSVDVLDLDTGEFRDLPVPADGTLVTELPAGRYSMVATLVARRPAGTDTPELVLVGDPDVSVDGKTRVPLDARRAEQVRFDTPRRADHAQMTLGHTRFGSVPEASLSSSWMMPAATARAYVVPSAKAELGIFEFFQHWDLYTPVATAKTVPGGKDVRLVHMEYGPAFDGRRFLAVFDGGTREDFSGDDLKGKLALLTYQPGKDAFPAIESALKAGAPVVVLAAHEPGGSLAFWGSGLSGPAFTTGHDEAAALRKAGRVLLEGTSVSPFWYDVTRWSDRMPRDVRYEISPRTMARIRASYHDTAAEEGYGTRATFPPNTAFMVLKPSTIKGAMTREEWTTPGDVVVRSRFQRSALGGAELQSGDRSYRAGQRVDEHWFAPGGPGQPRALSGSLKQYGLPPVRQGDTVRMTVPEYGDSDPDHFGFPLGGGDATSAKLYRGDTLIGEGPQIYNVELPFPAERADYRLEQTSSRTADWWGTAVKTATTWWFSSGHTPKAEVLPLLKVDYDFGVDLANAVRSGRRHTIEFSVRPPTGAAARPIAGATARISYDDGATWSDLRVERRHGGFAARADHRGRTGHASVKVTAWDSAGAKVEETITRAFALRP